MKQVVKKNKCNGQAAKQMKSYSFALFDMYTYVGNKQKMMH